MSATAVSSQRERIKDVGYHFAPKEHLSRCPVCMSASRSLLIDRDRYGFEAKFYDCDGCGAVYLSPRLSQQQYTDFYQQWYRQLLTAWYGRDMLAADIESDQIEYGRRVLPSLAPELSGRSGQSLLDVGGSTGIMADMMRTAYGLVPTVVDPSPEETEAATGRNVEAILGTLDDVPLYRQFDVITMFQTIEHLSWPMQTLRRVSAMLKPGGFFILDAVPFNVMRTGVQAELILKIDHPIYFAHGTILKLLGSSYLRLHRWTQSEGVRQYTYICESVRG